MAKQTLSIEQMQHLNELGVDTRTASLCWVCLLSEPYISFYDKEYPQEDTKVIPAFTLQDILDLLPHNVDNELFLFIEKGKNKWRIGYTDKESEEIFEDFSDEELIDAAYEMLCWCVENGYLETKE